MQAKSGGGEDMNGGMAELALMQSQTSSLVPMFPVSGSQPNQPAQTRVALSFLLSEKGNFFREFLLDEIVKGIDAITREQLVQAMAVLGFRNATPIFGMVPTLGPFRPAALLPSVTEEDKVILNNDQKVIEFLTARSSISNNPDQVVDVSQVVRELLPALPGIYVTVLPEIMSRLGSRIMARIARDMFL